MTVNTEQIHRTYGVWQWAEYSTLSISDEASKYTLTVAGYSGDACDASYCFSVTVTINWHHTAETLVMPSRICAQMCYAPTEERSSLQTATMTSRMLAAARQGPNQVGGLNGAPPAISTLSGTVYGTVAVEPSTCKPVTCS